MQELLEASAIRSAPTRRSTSSARTGRPRHADDGRASACARLRVGAYISPHVRGWSRADPGRRRRRRHRGGARARPGRTRRRATQFEVITAAAFAEFAAQRVDVAVVEAGLGGRLDATNVLARAGRRADERRARAHRRARRHPRGDRGREARRRHPGAVVVLGEPEWDGARARAGASRVDLRVALEPRLAVAAAEAFLGRDGRPDVAEAFAFPAGSSTFRAPLEIRDGAHNLAGVGCLLARLPAREYVDRRLDPR